MARWIVIGSAAATLAATAAGLGLRARGSQAARPAAAPRAAPRAVTISAVGDITLGHDAIYPPGGPPWLLRLVRPAIASDVAVGNLETTLGSSTGSKCGAGSSACFAFGAPAAYAGGLRRVGFDLLNIANNHANDGGPRGVAVTTAALTRAGIRFTGTRGRITYVRQRGVRLAFVGFAPYRWAQDLLDIRAAQRLVRRADRRADLVVVTMHAGAEGLGHEHVRPGMESYVGELRGDAVRFSRAVVSAGADLVLGSGPHVLRGLEWYRGRLIAYSLGNFSGWHTLSTAGNLGVSAVLRIRLAASARAIRARVVPLRLDAEGRPDVDSGRAAWALLRTLSRQDFGARGVRIRADGSVVLPAGVK